MSKYEKFRYNSLEDLMDHVEVLGLDLQFSQDISPLFAPVKVGKKEAVNAMSTLPMEGCDSEPDGSPSELVRRRYLRFARGGYGLIWWEACAVVEEGKANDLQMFLRSANTGAFEKLLADVNRTSREINGFAPLNILQLTHSGRYSRPRGHEPQPLIAQRDPILDPRSGVLDDSALVSDTYLESLIPRYVTSARLAQEAGFDGVDVKACHRYLLNELLASYTRKGPYGGSFEGRTRLLLTLVSEIRKACGPDFIVACRFNAYDAHPYPYGFGCDPENMWIFDPHEPVALARALRDEGVDLLSCTMGNPYYIYPFVGRPFDPSDRRDAIPLEHPLESLDRLFSITGKIQAAVPEIPVVGGGYTWLRQFIPHAGAANIRRKACQFIGFGRSAFAYPQAPRDLKDMGALEPAKLCITCGKCTQIMRDHGRTGCVVKDAKVYAPLFLQYRRESEARASLNKKGQEVDEAK